MTARPEIGVPQCRINPKFLHSNSTSHAGPFSAIAELIDNAYDPDVRAKAIWIDVLMLRGQQVLSFMDNGNGLTYETMHKMLSFGYSDKVSVKGIKPIGMYGNGFKSGAMRLGRDAIVLSKSESTSCVGMLSQTYLEDIKADNVVVPVISFEQSESNQFSVREDQQASLEAILQYSPYRTQDELLQEISVITSLQSTTKTGTRIIIWNLRRTSNEKTELDFKQDPDDIQFPPDVSDSSDDTAQQPGELPAHIPESSYSLRAYCSILYLKPRMKIILRGIKVKTQLIAKSLAVTVTDYYKPAFLSRKIPITFGYNTKSKHQYGVMMYHKNRLIRAYERVGCQLRANYEGVGVIGVIECGDFLEPTHNKQSFNETDKYRKTMSNLGGKLNDYWKEIRHRRKEKDPKNSTPVEDIVERPDQNWVQCEDCLRWRKVPDGFEISPSEKWTCSMNTDPNFRSCEVEEEPEDCDDGQAGYAKTHKQLKKLGQKKQKAPSNTQSSYTNVAGPESPQGFESYKLRSFSPQQDDCSPPGSSGPPANADVSSPSTTPQRAKRTQSDPQPTTAKRQKVQGQSLSATNTSTMMDVPKNPDEASTTQTETLGVKEEEAQNQTEDGNMAEQSSLNIKVEQSSMNIKVEQSSMNIKVEDQSQDEYSETHLQDDEEKPRPSNVWPCDTDIPPGQITEAIQSSLDPKDHLPDHIPEITQSSPDPKDQIPNHIREITQSSPDPKDQLPNHIKEITQSSPDPKDQIPNHIREITQSSPDPKDQLPNHIREITQSSPDPKDQLPDQITETIQSSPDPKDQLPDQITENMQSSPDPKDQLPDQVTETIQSSPDPKDQLPDQITEIILSSPDPFEAQVVKLTNQLQDMQHRLQQLEETQDGCFNSLFEKAKQKFDELIDLLKDIKTQRSTALTEVWDMYDNSMDHSHQLA
ncbi:MORC family CW-type zinc finger protein 3-like [Halichoeres trimaculatus]|uniref:MORC family CW-type zinc finger protein 3-like n=1 Tax=Halichoeres trimaculatus TaxID=147232 RepID=UPI003D9F74E4